MSTKKWAFFAFILCLALPSAAFAAFDSGSTGALGNFTTMLTSKTVVLPPDGILNYGTVSIPAGKTVYFQKNANNTPVTILATGDVTISGTISVAGGAANTNVSIGVSGPGGYDGGKGGPGWGFNGYKGDGPGGGGGGNKDAQNGTGAGGGYGWAGANSANGGSGGSGYGNNYIVPLMGGSGGGGAGCYNGIVGAHGGGGGGAILISSSGTITINGAIWANGGKGGSNAVADWWSNACYYVPSGGGGSGGSIRLVADTIQGNGTLNADGGAGGTNIGDNGWCPNNSSYNGGQAAGGRIRLEANNFTRTSATSPSYTRGYPSTATYPATLPTLAITSVGGVAVPQVPKATYNNVDVTLPYGTQNPVPVVVTATNIPSGTNVTVTVIPQTGSTTTATAALSGSTATVNVNLVSTTVTPYVLMVSASGIPVASLYGDRPVYAEGERVKSVKITSTMGEGSKMFYVTESGKEVPVRFN